MSARVGIPALGLAACLVPACTGSGGGEPGVSYGSTAVLPRVGEAVTVQPNVSGAAVAFTVTPDLPSGLVLDPTSGELRGTPTTSSARQTYTVVAAIDGSPFTTTFDLAVGASLPAEVQSLEAGFECTRVATVPSGTAKIALAPDGRAFVTELMTGSILVVDAGGLVPTPFATVSVLGGGHLGLLGVAVSPDFATDGHVFAYACTPAGGGKPDRGRLLRWRAVGNTGTDETVLLDDLPVSAINNGGALCFDASGMLLLSIGDTEDPAAAQLDTSFAGKVLRIRPSDGGVPADNPDPASHVFAKGLRNTFALTLHPTLGNLFSADNGPVSDDELNLLQAGKNFEWGGVAGSYGAATGAVLRTWSDVVVPTGLAFQDPTVSGWPEPFGSSLYLTLYDDQVVERFAMSGAQRTDIDGEFEFLQFAPSGTDNVPVDVVRGPAGALWVLTFRGVFKVDRID